MDKEKILSENKKDNLYLDEYEKHLKLRAKSFGLTFVLIICMAVYCVKSARHDNNDDILAVIGAVSFGFTGYEAYFSKNTAKIILSLFFFVFMAYYLIQFLMTGL